MRCSGTDRRLVLVVAALGSILVARAGSSVCPPTTVSMQAAIDVATWPDAPFRWKDIAANRYDPAYQDTYRYAGAEVTLAYETCSQVRFAGLIAATNLKPNFAYQLKLVGKPTSIWGEGGDDQANENIGWTGRWWRVQPNPGNASDADYEAHRDDPDYVYEGYLVFDFCVTDTLGNLALEFLADSSYHVLWWSGQRTPQPCDGPIRWHTAIGHAEDPAYTEDVGPTAVGVYAEIERDCTGTSRLPPGHYNCRLLMTEESFHQSDDNDGWWASAMAYDELDFDILDPTAAGEPAPPHAGPALAISPNPFNPRTVIVYEMQGTGPARLQVFDLRGRSVAILMDGTVAAGRHEAIWNGRDSTGRKVPGGVYLLRLESKDGAPHGKATLVR